MTDRIPNQKPSLSKRVEEVAKLHDIAARAKAVRPVDTGRDIMRAPSTTRDIV